MPGLTATTDLLHVFGDPTRVRLLALLARHELTVAELTTILEVAQSRVSTHLGRLPSSDRKRRQPMVPATISRTGRPYRGSRASASPMGALRSWTKLWSHSCVRIIPAGRSW